MSAQRARVIDLESFRARRNGRAAAVPVRAPLIWVPVVAWFPVWRMLG